MRAEHKSELPKLPGGLPKLRTAKAADCHTATHTAIRGAGTLLGCQQRPWPDWMVGAHAARAKPIGPGRDVRAEHKLASQVKNGTKSAGFAKPSGKMWPTAMATL